MHKGITFALAAVAAGAAAAQGARPDPASPQGRAAPTEYRSAFEGYRPFAEEKPVPWREANEVVKSEGGAHAGPRQKTPAEAKPAAKPPAGGGHGAHK